MRTLKNITDFFVGKSIITDLVELMRVNDEVFLESEKQYNNAVKTLRIKLPVELAADFEGYLNACETDIISAVAYAGHLGYLLNLENFRHPIGVDFVHLDSIDYIKGHLFGHFPVNDRNAVIQNAFRNSLPEEFRIYDANIQDYFTHLECAGPKLAHYAGYVIANQILPWVEPGYCPDEIQTRAFAAETKRYMGFLPL